MPLIEEGSRRFRLLKATTLQVFIVPSFEMIIEDVPQFANRLRRKPAFFKMPDYCPCRLLYQQRVFADHIGVEILVLSTIGFDRGRFQVLPPDRGKRLFGLWIN